MASITCRVTGQDESGNRVIAIFRDTDEGRRQARSCVRNLKDSAIRYDVRFRIAGRQMTRTLKTRKEADALVVTVEADKVRGTAVDPRAGRTAFEEYATAWLAERHDLRARTTEDYRDMLRIHLLPAFGAIQIANITPSGVRRWYANLSKRLPGRAHKAYRLLRAILNTAVADELIVRNPCKIRGASQDQSAERAIPTVAEVEALEEAMPDRLRLLVLLMSWCGLRRGEVLALRRRDVDLMHGSLRVDRALSQLRNGSVSFGPPKTDAGRRSVHYPPHLRVNIESHLAEHVGPSADDLLFKGAKGGPLRPHVLQKTWLFARQKVGVGYRLHDLRHLGATLAAATGASTKDLMLRLGHASPQAALVYQHATGDRDRAIAVALTSLAEKAPVLEFPVCDESAMEAGGKSN